MMGGEEVTIVLPSVLGPVMQGRLKLSVCADSLGGAMEAIKREHPGLALHLFDESGGLREHVLCFHNGTNTRWLENLDRAIGPGDTLLFMQAVSGG